MQKVHAKDSSVAFILSSSLFVTMAASRTVQTLVLLTLFSFFQGSVALTPNENAKSACSRKAFFQSMVAATIAAPLSIPQMAYPEEGRLGLSDEQLKEIVKSDILDKQFLATGKLTSSIYRPTATFTDEIDTYAMDQWVKGTQKLFVGEKSQVRLVGDVNVSPEKVEFKFDEDLMFRIPLRPTVSLTGTVVLARDESGYITSYREFWDQDVLSVLKTARF